MFRKQMKHSKRYQEILNAFFKNGFSHFLFRIGLKERALHKEEISDMNMNFKDIGVKLRFTLQSLGPTFIKLGQIASSRHDLIPKEIADELAKLQDDVAAFAYSDAVSIIEKELGMEVHDLFASLDPEPLATASIGQVHAATLFSGEEVVIKVQRPDIEKTIQTDLEILRDLARLVDDKIKWARTYHVRDMIEEFAYSLYNELNYIKEARNGERLQKLFSDDPFITIPSIHWELTTRKVLTMERIYGIKVSEIETLNKEGYNRRLIADKIADAMLRQVIEYGFFHGDPHPGNIFVLPNNRVAFIDFGMVGHLLTEMRHHFISLLLQLKQQNAKGMIKTFSKMDLLDEVDDIRSLERDLDMLLAKYYDASLEEINLGQVIMEIFQIAFQYNMDIPKDISMIGKAILTTEEIIKRLDPTFRIIKAIEPYGEKILKDKYHPKKLLEQSYAELSENLELLKDLPKDAKQITNLIKRGKVQFEMNITELQSFLKRMDRISNRLSFSIILLSFSILMGGLIIGASISGHAPSLWNLPVIEIGAVIATLMFLFMIFTIIRSGRM